MVGFYKDPKKKNQPSRCGYLNPIPMVAHTSSSSSMFHSNPSQDDIWIIDTGAFDHMKNNPSKLLKNYTPKFLKKK